MREFYEFDEQQYQGKGRIWKYIAVAIVFALLGAIGMYYMLPYISDKYSDKAVVTPKDQEQKVAGNEQANQDKDKQQLPELGYKGDLFITSDNPVVEIAEKVGPAVVGITNKSIITYRDWFFGDVYMQEQEGYGSGIIISDEGYIVTNAHVVEGAKELYVVFQGEKQVPAQLVGMDTTSDVAVVKVDPQVFKEVKYAVAKLGDSDKVRPGELAVAIGNPLGHDLAGTITVGVISAVNRTLVVDQKPMKLIQTDAAINRGNSGGALVNAKGEVIGMNTLKGSGAEGLGFAIPTNEFLPIVKELIQKGVVVREDDKPGIGIWGQEITAADAKRLNYPQGILVRAVVQNGAAAKAGIQPGDVIIGFNDKPIKTFQELKDAINQHKVGDIVKIKIWRDGKEFTLPVTLEPLREE
ncbi:serine protease Do [Caldicoprobacter guelmensis]|uniref:S1C family serine protease n=1 Tax=Caldicoprobacter guelmensis TaxID=1170224 RepID=UPI0019590C80|nr:trypsin-like peptidase domain-containing protein [Caldicoprobacter guelmensis]MBM7581663.1 serine protease Do [Caldicoprobacter guelmensis]